MRTLMMVAIIMVFVIMVCGCVQTYVNSGEGNDAGPVIEHVKETSTHSQIDSEIIGINKGHRITKKRTDQQ